MSTERTDTQTIHNGKIQGKN